MLIENYDALKKYLMESLDGVKCDADPKALTRYIIALLRKPRSEDILKEFFLDQLEVFLTKNTRVFVEKLFEAINSRSYLSITERIAKPEKSSIKTTKRSEATKSPKKEKTFVTPGLQSFQKQSSFSETSYRDEKCWSRKKDLLPMKGNSKMEVIQKFHRNKDFLVQKKSSNLVSVPLNVSKSSFSTQRCKDYDEKGYCLRGDACTFYHGSDPVVVENIPALNLGTRYIPEPYNPEQPIIGRQRGDTDCKNNLLSHTTRKRKNMCGLKKSDLHTKRMISEFSSYTLELKIPKKSSHDTDLHSSSLKKLSNRSVVDMKSFPSLSQNVSLDFKANVSSSGFREKNQREEKKLALNLRDLFDKKLELTKKEIQHQKLIFQRLKRTRDSEKRDVLKKISEDLALKIKTSLMELKHSLYPEKANSKSQKTKPVEREKKILDTEMDLYKILNKGHDDDIIVLLKKVNMLKGKAKAFGLLDPTCEKAGIRIHPSKPHTSRFCPKSAYPSKLLKTDNRPKALLVTGIKDTKRDFFVNFVLKFSGIVKIDFVSQGCIISFNSRKAAEMMLQKLIALRDENLSVAWYQVKQHVVLEDLKVSAKKEDDRNFYNYDEDMDEDEEDDRRRIRSWRC